MPLDRGSADKIQISCFKRDEKRVIGQYIKRVMGYSRSKVSRLMAEYNVKLKIAFNVNPGCSPQSRTNCLSVQLKKGYNILLAPSSLCCEARKSGKLRLYCYEVVAVSLY